MVGRRRDVAPEGYVTVREAAERLGVSEQAVRQRVQRGTLEVLDATTPGGETRYYIPKEAIEEAERKRRGEEARVSSAVGQVGVDELVARLDELSERQERTERIIGFFARPEQLEVSALREQLEEEQGRREAAERERDELRSQIRRLVDPE